MATRLHPALDVHLLAPSPDEELADLVLAEIDDLGPIATEEIAAPAAALRIHFGHAAERDAAVLRLRARPWFHRLTVHALDLSDEGWAERSQANLHALRIGDVVVAPPWDCPASVERDEIALVIIQPSMGFGTGHHATTRLCLAALQRLSLRESSVLDVGTGSGVLAITAVRLGAARAVGVDIDPDALASARENLLLNGVTDRIELQEADLAMLGGVAANVVTANLTGALLVRLASRLASLVQPGGHLVLSGFLLEEEAAVRAAFAPWTAHATGEFEGEWGGLTVRVGGAGLDRAGCHTSFTAAPQPWAPDGRLRQ